MYSFRESNEAEKLRDPLIWPFQLGQVIHESLLACRQAWDALSFFSLLVFSGIVSILPTKSQTFSGGSEGSPVKSY